MPRNRYPHRELSHNWDDIRPLLKDSTQLTYEIIRPVVLFGVSPKERSEEMGMSKSSIYYKANLFDQAGMASLFPPTPPPELPKQDKRALPPPIRQVIVDAHAEYPALSLHEIASLCYVQFGRKPSPHTIQYILAIGPQPPRTGRRYKRFAEIDNPVERRKTILKFRNFLLYGEQGLAGRETLVNIFQKTLTLEYEENPLSKYSVEWQPDERNLLRVGNPRLFQHPYQTPQLSLWESGEVEWHVIIRCEPQRRHRKHVVRSLIIPLPFFQISDGTQGG